MSWQGRGAGCLALEPIQRDEVTVPPVVLAWLFKMEGGKAKRRTQLLVRQVPLCCLTVLIVSLGLMYKV